MSITKQQWDILNDEQKKLFQEEVGKDFNNGIYPERDDILIFLGNNKLSMGVKSLKERETPPVVKETDDLWKDVVGYLASK